MATLKVVTRPYLCCQCGKHDVVDGGYHVNIEHQPGLILMHAVGHGKQYDETKFEHHVCGRACYVLLMNAAFDKLERPLVTASQVRKYNQPWEAA